MHYHHGGADNWYLAPPLITQLEAAAAASLLLLLLLIPPFVFVNVASVGAPRGCVYVRFVRIVIVASQITSLIGVVIGVVRFVCHIGFSISREPLLRFLIPGC